MKGRSVLVERDRETAGVRMSDVTKRRNADPTQRIRCREDGFVGCGGKFACR